VIDEEAPADAGPRMDLDPGQPAAEMGDEPGKPLEPVVPQPVAETVDEHRMHPRVGGEDLETVAGRRIAVVYTADVFSDALEHAIRYAGKRRSLETGRGWVSTGARLAKARCEWMHTPRMSRGRPDR